MNKPMQYRLPSAMINSKVSVALVGVGGSGGYMLEALTRIHAVLKELDHKGFAITVFDDDVVSESNIGRTKFSPMDVGQYKADVLVSRYNLFFGLDMVAVNQKFAMENVSDFDLVVTCTDSAEFRVELGEHSLEWQSDYHDHDVLWLDMGNEDFYGNFFLGHIVSENIEGKVHLPNVYDLYKNPLIEASKKQDNKSSCGLLEAVAIQSLFINQAVATHASALLYELFKSGCIENHGGLIDLAKLESKPMPINPRVWEFMGVENRQILEVA